MRHKQESRARKRSLRAWELRDQRFNSQKRKQNRAIATGPSRRDMARPKGCQRRETVRELIILTGFSRCQGGMIGRVSRRSKQATTKTLKILALKIRIFHDLFVIPHQIRPRLDRGGGLSCVCHARRASG